MKAKNMSVEECEHGKSHHPKGKALLEIAIGLILIAFALGIYDLFVSAGLVGALIVLKGSVRYWEVKCLH